MLCLCFLPQEQTVSWGSDYGKGRQENDLNSNQRDGQPGADVFVVIFPVSTTRKTHASALIHVHHIYKFCPSLPAIRPSPPWIPTTSTLRE